MGPFALSRPGKYWLAMFCIEVNYLSISNISIYCDTPSRTF